MAEELRFEANLIDAMSAPLNAIAENLLKVADAMTKATQVFQDGFDASVKASESLTQSMSNLGEQVDNATKQIDSVGTTIQDSLVPALENVDTNIEIVDKRIASLSTDLKDNATAVTDNTTSLENLIITQEQLVPQVNAVANASNTLAQQLYQNSLATDENTVATDAMRSAQKQATDQMLFLEGEVRGLGGEMAASSALTQIATQAAQDNTDALSAQTRATVDQTAAAQAQAKVTGDSVIALVDNTTATNSNTLSQSDNTTAVKGLTKAYQSGAGAVNNYTNAQKKSAKANADANAAGKAGEGDRKAGYGAILGATMLLGMAGAAARVGIDLVKMGMDGETALNHVAALTGASASEMQLYKTKLEELAPVAGKTIGDLANGLYDVVSVGYTGAGAMKVLTASAYAAAAGGTDLHTVTNGLTGIMRAYSMSADQAQHATDVLIKGVQLGKSTFADFSRAVGLVGVVSEESGFKIEESTAALATLTQVYPSVRQAGQNLQNLIQNVGVSYADVEKRVKATGKAFDENKFEAEGLQGRLQMLWQVSGHNTEVFKKLVGNVTAAKAGFYLIGVGAQQFTDNLTAMAHASDGAGVTLQAMQTHMQTMQAHIDEMKGALSVLAMHFAAIAAPFITAGLTLVTKLFTALATFIEKHVHLATAIIIMLAGVIGGLLVGAIAALNAALGPMLAASFEIAAPFVIAGAVIAIFAAVLKHAYDTSQPFRDAVHQLWGALHELGSVIGQLVAPVLAKIVGHVKNLADGLGNLFGHTEAASQTFFRWETVTKRVNGHLVTVHQRVEDVRQVLGHVRGPLSFVVDAIRHFAEAIHSLADKVRAFLPHLQHTQVMAHNLSDGVTNLHNRFKPLENVIETTTQVASKHGDVLKRIWDVVKQVGGVLLSIIGPFGLLGTVMSVIGFLRGPAMLQIMLHVMAALKGLQPVIHGVSDVMGIFGKALAVGKTTGDPFAMILKVIIGLVRGGLMAAITGALTAFMSWVPVILTIIGVVTAVVTVIIAVVYAVQHWWKTSAAFHAILKAVVDSLKDFWNFLVASIHPVLVQLQDTLKNQLLPAWKSLQDAFEQAKPALLLIAGIIGAILVVAFGILMGLLRGLVALFAMLLVGAIRLVGGIVQAFSGIILFFASLFGGIAKIFDDFRHGHLERIPKDIVNMLLGMNRGVQQIMSGLGNAILGIIVGVFGGILNFIGGFVQGFLGFFQHIWERLVGHSIIPDTVNGIVMWIHKLPTLIFDILKGLVGGVIGFFTGMHTQAGKVVSGMVGGIAGTLGGLVKNALPNVAKFAVDGLKHIGTLEVQGVQHAVKFAGSVVQNVGQMEVNGLKHIGSLAQNGLNLFNQMADQMSGKAKVMHDKVALEHLEMKAQSLTHVAEMNVQEVHQLENMRTHILDELAHTKDGAKRHALEMQLGVVDQSIQMHKNAANAAMHQRTDVNKQINDMKVQTQKDAHDMNTNVVSQAIQMGQNFVNNVASMAGNVGGKIKNMADDIVKKITDIGGRMKQAGINLIQSLIDGIGSMVGNVANAAGNIAKTIGDHLHFGSPTKKGEGRTVMEWMPNLVNQLSEDLARGEQKVGTSAAKLAASIRQQIVNGTNNTTGAGANLGAGGAALIGAGNNANAKQEVHLHLEGGLGAGLQLLDPASRRRFARQIAEEMGRGVGMQGRLDNGYSGF